MRSAAIRCRRTRGAARAAPAVRPACRNPQALAGWAELIDAWAQIGTALSAMTPAIYELDLQATCEALAPAGRGGARPPVGGADLGPVPGGPGAAAHGGAARPQAG